MRIFDYSSGIALFSSLSFFLTFASRSNIHYKCIFGFPLAEAAVSCATVKTFFFHLLFPFASLVKKRS